MINIANRFLAYNCQQCWGQQHKFIDPCMCPELVVKGDPTADDQDAFETTIDNVIELIKIGIEAAYPANEDKWGWIFLPYNIEYDFQTFNYTKLYIYIFPYSQALISNYE